MDNAIAVYDEFRSQLAALKDFNSKTVFDYEDPKGNKDARSHIYKLRQTKAAIDKVRKEEKAVSLEYGRKVDAQAKEITVEVDAMIDIHAKPIEAIEKREQDRRDRHKENLEEIVLAGQWSSNNWMSLPVEAMKDRLSEIERQSMTKEFWDEFLVDAAEAKDAAMILIRAAIVQREKYDAEQAELSRLRKSAEEQASKDRDEAIRNEAAQKEKADAEARLKHELGAGERRELELKLAAERAQREKVEAERRADDAEAKAKRDVEEAKKREVAEATAREADKKHRSSINNEAMAAFVKDGFNEEQAKRIVTLIAKKAVPHVTISY